MALSDTKIAVPRMSSENGDDILRE